MNISTKAHHARFNGRKAEKFGMLAMIKNGGFYMPHVEIARLLGISKRTLQAWLADEDYQDIERLYKQVQEEGDQLSIDRVEEMIA